MATIVKVPENREEEFVSNFYNTSAFTFEGIDLSNKKENEKMEKAFREAGFKEKDFVIFTLTGKVMNRIFSLTEANAYPDDITIAVIPNFYDPIFKLQVGARWFDDIVCNNRIRQNEINCGVKDTLEDYGYEENEGGD